MDISRRKFIPSLAAACMAPGLFSFTGEDHTVLPNIRPNALKKGDLIAITSPAGVLRDFSQADAFANRLQSLGYRVLLGDTVRSKAGYLAGSDELRRNELMRFFADEKVKAIVCMKGGYGTTRIIDQLDYNLIRKNPKIFMGFSDITALINAIYKKSGLVCFHGPVGNSSWNDYSLTYMNSVLVHAHKTHYRPGTDNEDAIHTITGGKAEGELAGGNLSVLAGLTGTPFFPDLRGKLLFLEEVKEEPFRIDRMLSQWRLAGELEKPAGIIIGKFRDCVAEEKDFSFTCEEVLNHYFSALKIPVYSGAMIGHIINKYTLPIGVRAIMDADKGEIQLLEPAVNIL